MWFDACGFQVRWKAVDGGKGGLLQYFYKVWGGFCFFFLFCVTTELYVLLACCFFAWPIMTSFTTLVEADWKGRESVRTGAINVILMCF